jgi:hypothetical protein
MVCLNFSFLCYEDVKFVQVSKYFHVGDVSLAQVAPVLVMHLYEVL